MAVAGKIKYSRKKPDMSRNTALAGKTVYSRGMNVTYNDLGYAVNAYYPSHPQFKGTTRSIPAQPIADALAGKPWQEPSHEGLIEWEDFISNGGVCPDGESGETPANDGTEV